MILTCTYVFNTEGKFFKELGWHDGGHGLPAPGTRISALTAELSVGSCCLPGWLWLWPMSLFIIPFSFEGRLPKGHPRNDLEWPFTGRRQVSLVCGVQSCPILCFSVESLKCVTVSLLLFRQWQFPAEFSRHISFDLSLRGRFSSCCQFVMWPFFYLQVFGVSTFLCELCTLGCIFLWGQVSLVNEKLTVSLG